MRNLSPKLLLDLNEVIYLKECDFGIAPNNALGLLLTREEWAEMRVGIDSLYAVLSDEEIKQMNDEEIRRKRR